MEKRNLRVIFCKDGRGATNSKITLPIKFLKSMGITPEERDVELICDEEKKQIIIKKAN